MAGEGQQLLRDAYLARRIFSGQISGQRLKSHAPHLTYSVAAGYGLLKRVDAGYELDWTLASENGPMFTSES